MSRNRTARPVCARRPPIVLMEASLPYELLKVESGAPKKLENGEDDLKLKPKGKVPALGPDSARS